MLRVDGRLQRRTIGRYPQLSLAQARTATLDMLRKASEGIDPRQPAPGATASLTYAQLVDGYVERHLKPNARSWADIKGSLLHTSLRHLFTRSASGIARGEIAELIDKILADGKPQAAVNVLRRLKMLFGWAVNRDLVTVNPCERIRPPAKTIERDRVLADVEIVAVWRASETLPPPYGQMYRMFLLTGQRRSEVATMRWCDVQGDLWTIPRAAVKKDRAHAVPLTATAVATLATLPCYGTNSFVFTTTGGRTASSNFNKVKREVDRLSGTGGWTIHDIRRTVRSKLAELGVPEVVARKVMNHEAGKVDRIYNRHAYLDEKREALERWQKRLMEICHSVTC